MSGILCHQLLQRPQISANPRDLSGSNKPRRARHGIPSGMDGHGSSWCWYGHSWTLKLPPESPACNLWSVGKTLRFVIHLYVIVPFPPPETDLKFWPPCPAPPRDPNLAHNARTPCPKFRPLQSKTSDFTPRIWVPKNGFKMLQAAFSGLLPPPWRGKMTSSPLWL